jgi:hypothetical protein
MNTSTTLDAQTHHVGSGADLALMVTLAKLLRMDK